MSFIFGGLVDMITCVTMSGLVLPRVFFSCRTGMWWVISTRVAVARLASSAGWREVPSDLWVLRRFLMVGLRRFSNFLLVIALSDSSSFVKLDVWFLNDEGLTCVSAMRRTAGCEGCLRWWVSQQRVLTISLDKLRKGLLDCIFCCTL